MNNMCRLCCSENFVHNDIFDEVTALYLKMSLYLPIKVFKNDRLPQRVCDKCSLKVNDFYQFCNEAIEVQHRLRASLLSGLSQAEESVDLTIVKDNVHSPQSAVLMQARSIPALVPLASPALVSNSTHSTSLPNNTAKTDLADLDTKEQLQCLLMRTCEQSTQTEVGDMFDRVQVKVERDYQSPPRSPIPKFLSQPENTDNFEDLPDMPSENSEDDMLLIALKKKKKKIKKEKITKNGDVKEHKKGRKRKEKSINLNGFTRAVEDSTAFGTEAKPKDVDLSLVKVEPEEESLPDLDFKNLKNIKSEINETDVYHCCICFVQCFSRAEMLKHYRTHAKDVEQTAPPPAPPVPDGPLKCMRCQKLLEPATWAPHWLRHWERDRRPFRCALCERAFRDPHQILKHGETHDWSGGEGAAPAARETAAAAAGGAGEKRFVCDLCPESFVFMRFLLAHRSTAHPEALGRALALRCAACGRHFAHVNSLRRHLRAHAGARDHLCNVCGKALSSREHLKFHLRIHAGYKPNVCRVCGKGFVKKCNLTLHERVHSGEKPHVCPHCGKAFSQRSTLVIHERYHSGARPYVCGVCGRGFVAKGLLSMHAKTTCV